jgi:restriction endonuclease S subunit
MNNGGILLRDEVLGVEIGTKNQFRINQAQFLLSKIDARNGAFGVVPTELDNGIITGNFWTFDVDTSFINPHYLSILTGTPMFQRLCQSASVGTTNRNYLQEDLFLDFEIPLPSLTEQEEILAEYNAKMQEAERLKVEIELLKKTYDEVFFSAFSIERPKPIVKKTGLQFVPFSTLSRWDALSSNFIFTDALKSSTYNLVPLGVFAKFVSRSWNKKTQKDDTFNYIELGGVNPDLGIESYSTLDKKEAPSRATQTVKEGDLIIGTTRPYLKRFAIVQEEHNDFVCSSGFSVIEPTEEVNLYFLKYYLMSCFGEEQLSNNMSGALYPAITSKSLMEDIYIPEIDIEQQNEIANQILTINEKITLNYRKIDETQKEALTDFEAKIFKN